MTGIPDDAVEALAVELLMQSYVPRDAVSEAHARNRWRLAGYGELRAAYRERARAGLAAALPHLADACDALRAAERSRVSTLTPEPITAVSGNLSGLQGHSAPTHNPTDTTQED